MIEDLKEVRIKEAFSKIKQEMDELRLELISLRGELTALKEDLSNLKTPIKQPFSIGNEGVPTNKQTNKPTHNTYPTHPILNPTEENNINQLVEELKTDLKRKFRALTKQEFMIFSVIFTVEKELELVTYKDIAKRTGLSEASIRDYIMRIIAKGIPILKEKVNNKTVTLKIPTDLRNISTLESLMKLRNDTTLDKFLDDKI
jgi:DNA-directed RNA polymerase specialized sigma subunit